MTIDIARLSGLAEWVAPKSAVRASAPPPASGSSAAPDAASMQDAASRIQEYLSGPMQPPSFKVDYLSGLSVMVVRSANSGEVVLQMPGPAALHLAQLIKEGAPLNNPALVNETA